jgi:peptidoglycan/LPS O-acetylase OafA/YrhL
MPESSDGLATASAGFEHPQHFSDLDGLRGLLALSVVVYHYGINALIQRATGGRANGFVFDLSVDFFFLLSGYVLAHSMRKGPPTAPSFAVKRAFRLLPVYFLTLGVMIALTPWAAESVPYLMRAPTSWEIISDLLLIAPVTRGASLNVPAWSVAFEFFLPIAAVALTGPLGKTFQAFSLPLVISTALGLSYTSYVVATEGGNYGPRAILGLAGGCALYLAVPRLKFPAILFKNGALYGLILAMLAVMFLAGSTKQFAVLFPWIAILTIVAGTQTRTVLSSPPLAALGHLSYTLYMVHIPVLVASTLTFGSISGSALIKGGTLVAALMAAAILTILIERPAMVFGNALAKYPGVSRRG